MPRSSSRTLVAGLAVCAALAAGLAVRRWVARSGGSAEPGRATTSPVPPAQRAAPARDERTDAALEARRENERVEDMQTPWAAVDLDALRAELPDNIYWKMSAPTKDEAVLREREEERARWNVAYGKVLSSTATADEVDAYYAHRYRLSSDYVQFATYLLADYGDKLSAQDVGLLKIAVELNLARLEEIPRQTAEAHARCEAHDAARRAWLESEKKFAGHEND